ncbi:MAG: glycosyltransferase family 4 protein [Rhodobacteraceae bacterium]|nr:glycosyltransferase family 4 protein [Paracoccaceae bacterium]
MELAYLTHLLADPLPLFVLVRTALGYALLDRVGAQEVAQRISGEQDWGRADLIGTLSRKANPVKRRAEADLRRLAVSRCRRGRLASMLSRALPTGCAYLNVGHSNLSDEVLTAWASLPGARVGVLVHDMIPLDYPQLQRPGTPTLFEAKMWRVADAADLIICNSRQTEADVQRWFGAWGRTVPSHVAHLGIDLPDTGQGLVPPETETDQPYFVTLGTIEPRKNHALLLDVWAQLENELPQAEIPHLIIVGSRGWANEDVFRRLDSLPMMGRTVHERAGLPDAAVAALIRGAAGVLFPSIAEGYGLPAAEAIALKTPVICSDLPVFREILGNIPVYADSADVYLWKQSVLQLAENKAAGQTGDAAVPFGSRLPTWADHFNLVLKVT